MNPIKFILALTYINIVRSAKSNNGSIVVAQLAASQNAFVLLGCNLSLVGILIMVLNYPPCLFISISIVIGFVFFIEEYKYLYTKKGHFRTTLRFLRKYKNQEKLINKHYKIYFFCSLIAPVVLFSLALWLRSF